MFGFIAGIGIPENPFLPSLNFQDFCLIKEGPLVWKHIASLLVDKYKKLSLADKDKDSTNTIFYNKLLKHAPNKSILVFGGSWSFSGISFARRSSPTVISLFTPSLSPTPHKHPKREGS